MADEIKNEGGGDQGVFVDYAVKAVKEHIRFEQQSIEPYRVFVSDTDVYVGLYGITVHAGMYLLKAEINDINEALVYAINFDVEAIAQAYEGMPYEETTDEKTGVTLRTYGGGANGEDIPISFSATVEPIPTKEGKHLTYLEYLAWLSMTVAESDDTRSDIFKSAYGVDVNSVNAKASQGEELPQQDTARPRKRQDPKTKISRIIGIPEKNEKLYQAMGVPLTVASESEKRRGIDVEQIVAIEYKGADGIIAEGREQLTLLDRQVHNAIISHFVAGNRNISLVQICELVYGHNKPTEEQRREVEECIERQMWTRISIDMSDEARKHTLKHPELLSTNFTLEGQMLAIQKITVRATNGKKIVAYRLMGAPILSGPNSGNALTYLSSKASLWDTTDAFIIPSWFMSRLQPPSERAAMAAPITE